MALLIRLEDYRDIARQCRGTPACAAILGLVTEIEILEAEIRVMRKLPAAVDAAVEAAVGSDSTTGETDA